MCRIKFSLSWLYGAVHRLFTNALTRQTECGIGICYATGMETCIAGLWGDDTCTPGLPTETPEAVGKVIPSDRTYSFEDFRTIGFKKSKEYDVSGLPQNGQ